MSNNITNMAALNNNIINRKLSNAVHRGDYDEVNKLIKIMKETDYINLWYDFSYLLLCDSIKKGHTAIAILLLNNHANINPPNNNNSNESALYLAIENAEYEIVKIIVEKGADVNEIIKYGDYKGSSLLHVAFDNNEYEIVKLLINYNIDVNRIDSESKSCIFYTNQLTDLNIIELLFKNGANINIRDLDNNTPLFNAVCSSSLAIVNLFIKYGAQVNVKNKYNMTPLHFAVQNSSWRIIECLILNNSNINSADLKGLTPLHTAIMNGFVGNIKNLIYYGADVNAKDINGETPLNYAVQQEDMEDVIEELLKRNADVNCCDNNGLRPLHSAADAAFDEYIEILLDYGADIEAVDNEGRTALHMTDSFDNNYHLRWESVPLMFKLFKDHIYKLKSVNFYVGEDNFKIINDYYGNKIDVTDNFIENCFKEIEKMKKFKIGNTGIFYYDILKKSRHQVSKYAMLKGVEDAFKSLEYVNYFPLYRGLLKKSFDSAVKRKIILAIDKDNLIGNMFPLLPEHCVDVIISYLGDNDLKNAIESCY
ncbi:putative ankyrin repeat protein RF_0381 [Microplitis demolitor]|uniref:putative ankyrin repeat protein RF_0381 n=1 Tax=Microplitis demolitor TaxID=69319 RepID=UPI00235B6472|nr:putative ankyrin repeat protein RF_0381 [Microplitis demolitor]XP_053595834.1 putative ankyrin repeat protein RF_0381 [Microplitis demolitor]